MTTTPAQNSETNQSEQPQPYKQPRKTTLDFFEDALDVFATAATEMPAEAPKVLQHAGLGVIISGTQGGKSTLLRGLCQEFGGMFVELQEPTVDAARSLDELAEFISLKIEASEKEFSFLAIDSLRMLQFEAPGNARKGGISSGFYRLLTDITISALRRGITVICTLNPLANDSAEAIDNAMTDVESSVTSVIKGNFSSWEYISRAEKARNYTPLRVSQVELEPEEPMYVNLEARRAKRSNGFADITSRLTSVRTHAVATDGFDSITKNAEEGSISDLLSFAYDDSFNQSFK